MVLIDLLETEVEQLRAELKVAKGQYSLLLALDDLEFSAQLFHLGFQKVDQHHPIFQEFFQFNNSRLCNCINVRHFNHLGWHT